MEKVGLRFVEQYTEHTFRGDDKRAVRYRLTREQHAEAATATSKPEYG